MAKAFAIGDRVYHQGNGPNDKGTIERVIRATDRQRVRYIVKWDNPRNDSVDYDTYQASDLARFRSPWDKV